MARNQLDPNDRLELLGFDYIVCEDSSYETVDGAILDFIGTILVNGSPLVHTLSGYLHTQASPATIWTINHNLGYMPVVQVYNSGSIEVLCEKEHISVNQTVVRVSPAMSGFARCI